ncbi:MAG: hypothetical protein ACTSX4_12580, partial [Candidatus Helarchaeota archaeon]
MEDKIKYNSEIIRKQWIEDFDDTQKEIKRMIKEEFYSGIWGFLFNRIISWAFHFFLASDIREMALTQFDIYLKAAEEYDGDDEKVLEKYFEKYMKNDVGYTRCKRNHPKFPELR